jgi:Tol biopolymer transport system component
VITWPASGAAYYAASETGALLYALGGVRPGPTRLVWVDRAGRETPLTTEAREYAMPFLSPDGRRLVCWVSAANDKLWLFDLERGTFSRLTSGAGNDRGGCWSADGRSVVFMSDRGGSQGIYRVAADGSGSLEPLLATPNHEWPLSLSPDGTSLLFGRFDAKSGTDIWLLPLTGDRTPRPLITSPSNEGGARFSPDGRWFAYHSQESGEFEVLVTPFPGPLEKIQVSQGGAFAPRWSADGRELFFRTEDSLAVVPVPSGGGRRFGTPRMVLQASAYWHDLDGSFDVDPSGERFVFVKGDTSRVEITHLHLVMNWRTNPER